MPHVAGVQDLLSLRALLDPAAHPEASALLAAQPDLAELPRALEALLGYSKDRLSDLAIMQWNNLQGEVRTHSSALHMHFSPL